MAENDTSIASEGVKLDERSRYRDMVRSLKYRNFQLFFSGQLISLIGTWMDNIAEAWLVYRLTGSSLLLGTVAFAGQIPVFLLAPVGGMVADRWNRRSIVIATQISSMILAFILAFLTLTKRITVAEVITLAALMGIVNAFDIPARQAFLVEMVGREDLMNAIALNSSMFNGARIIGPSIAGILVASIGEGWCFFANAVSYIAVIAGLLMMRMKRTARPAQFASPFEHIVEGFRFVRDTAPILAILLLLGLVSVTAMPYSVLMPIFAAKVLHGNARTLGVLMGATGIGALTGALVLATRTNVQGLGRWISNSCVAFGFALILFSFSRWFALSVLLLVPVGCAMMMQMASSNTLIQAMVPDRLRGRTMAVYSMMFMGMAPLGALLSGALAERIGAPWTVAIGGVGAMIGGAVFSRAWPKLRVDARRLLVAQGVTVSETSPEAAAPVS
jgi:MFS family permease